VAAAFDGGTSDFGGLPLGAADRAVKLTDRLAAHDVRHQELSERSRWE